MLASALLAITMLSQAQTYNGEVIWDGMRVQASGTRRADGYIDVDWTSPFNSASLAAARAARPGRVTPGPLGAADPVWRTAGVVAERVHKAGYQAKGPTAQEFVHKAQSEDEPSPPKLHLTVIGTAEDCSKVLDGLSPEIRSRLDVQDYRPGDWAVDPKIGFAAGKPAIYLQEGRRVVYRAMDDSKGPAYLESKIREAQRKADPRYRPDKDPGPDSPAGFLGFTQDHVPFVIGTAILVAFIFFAGRRPGEAS